MQTRHPRADTLRAGDAVLVRSADDILATLDADGCLAGLPFMPEMLAWCGQPFRVLRRVEKTCTEVADTQIYSNRRFADHDVVLLDGPRCDGSAHDGCHRGCRIFWKEAWLQRDDDQQIATPSATSKLPELRERLKVREDADRYFCQSTQLLAATEAFPGKKKPWLVWIGIREVWHGDLAARTVAVQFLRWSWMLVRRVFGDDASLRGSNTRTPTLALHLQPGEIVRVKSRDEIAQTLDHHARNRGMGIGEEMTKFCGREAEVRSRVDRIIEEKTGKMRALEHTVMLRNLRGDPSACEECLCAAQIGDCPRGELMYWREIWLERVSDTRQ
jgi:hypothetical protein